MRTRRIEAGRGGAGSTAVTKSPTRRSYQSLERVERQSNFKVVVRVRPPLPRELSGEVPFQNIIAIDGREQAITITTNSGAYASHSYVFDHVYDPSSSQKKVYETTARGIVDSALQGYNATIFAYGQTGTGKTFTMEGFSEGSAGVEARGIIPRAIEQIFASYLQIYNEMISDLLKPERSNLSIREDKKRGVFVDGLSEWVVRSPAEIYGLMQRGGAVRATGETKMNEVSSRSHAVFIVIAEQSETLYKFMHGRGSFKVGKLNLVDLAGSERQINRSLAALGNVISALTDTKGRTHVPYRDSKLTRMLEDSLAMVETLSTLKFANRAKNIKNEARVNEDLDQKSLLRKYERELKKLRAELEERNKNVADKMVAIKALEARSKEFMHEKEEKKRLEQRIATLMGQMLKGDRTPDGAGQAPELQVIMKEQQDRLRMEYDGKLAEIERERETIEEEKAQVDRYKQLLLKQRDIMIALTQRLVERDEQIMALQDELDAYDRHQKELEEKLDEKTALLYKFQRISLEMNASSPFKSEELDTVLNESTSSRSKDRAAGATEVDSASGAIISQPSGDSLNEIVASSRLMGESAAQVNELSDLVDRQKAQIRELENALKAANESSGKGSDDNVSAAISQVEDAVAVELEIHLRRLEGGEDNGGAQVAQMQRQIENNAMVSKQSNAIAARCEHLVKEREAVHTIMEHKIKVLVQSIAQSVGNVLQGGGHNAAQALTKDVSALQRLVNASIAALRNAASNSLPQPI
eukprot:GSChrysophyteH1.ASY1.ANO1.2115.1 assembled CDS